MITPRNMADSAKTHTTTVVVPLNAVGVDVADIPFFRLPKDATIVEVGIIPQAAYTGNADGSTWLVEVGGNAIATATYTVAAAPPAAGVYASLGAITNAKQLEGAVLSYSVTNGAGAANPTCVLQIEYVIAEVI